MRFDLWKSQILELQRPVQKTLREVETAAQLCGRLGVVFSQQSFTHNHKAFRLIIFIFVTRRFATSLYGMHHLNLSIYIHTVNLTTDGNRA